jgi:hypothetical protein
MTFKDLDFYPFPFDGKSYESAQSAWFDNGYGLRVESGTSISLKKGEYLVKGMIKTRIKEITILGFPTASKLPIYFSSEGLQTNEEGVSKALLETESLSEREDDIVLGMRYKLSDRIHSFFVVRDRKRANQHRAICVLDGRYYGEFGYSIKRKSCEWPVYNVALKGRGKKRIMKYFDARLVIRNEKNPPRRMSRYDPPREPTFD